MRKFAGLLGLILLGLVAVSCTTFKLDGTQVTREIPSYNSVGTFDVTVKVHEFLGASGGANLLNITADAMNNPIYDAIQREIQKYSGDAAVNISIEYKAGFIDMILNGITGGIYAPATAEIKGTIVKYNK